MTMIFSGIVRDGKPHIRTRSGRILPLTRAEGKLHLWQMYWALGVIKRKGANVR